MSAGTFKYLTPTPTTSNSFLVSRVITCPAYLVNFVSGALAEFLEEWRWQQHGSLTPKETVNLFYDVYDIWSRAMLTGMIIATTGNQPQGTLLCDGATYQKDDYPNLWEVISDDLKTPTTFNTPNLLNKFVLGSDTANIEGGEEEHTLTLEEMPSHAHTYTPPTLNLDLEAPGAPDIMGAGIGVSSQTSNEGSGQAHNNMPPYYTLIYVIVI